MKFIFPGLSFLFALSLFACGESTESEPANSNRPSSDCPGYNAGSRNAKNDDGSDECSSESARCSYRDPNGNGSEYVSCFCNGGYYAEDGSVVAAPKYDDRDAGAVVYRGRWACNL